MFAQATQTMSRYLFEHLGFKSVHSSLKGFLAHAIEDSLEFAIIASELGPFFAHDR